MMQQAGAWCYSTHVSYIYRCPVHSLLALPPLPDDLKVVQCNRHTLDIIESCVNDFPPMLHKRVLQGDIVFLVVQNRVWVSRLAVVPGPGRHPVTGFPFPLADHEAFLHFAETQPQWRGKGINPRLLAHVADALNQLAFRSVYLAIAQDNASSHRVAEKIGAELTGVIRASRLLGRWTATCESAPIVGAGANRSSGT